MSGGRPATGQVGIVAGGLFQSAGPTGAHSLAGRSLAPGFAFGDFDFLAAAPGPVRALERIARPSPGLFEKNRSGQRKDHGSMALFPLNRTRPRRIGLLTATLLLLAACAAGDGPPPGRQAPDLEAKIGQMLMVGFRGLEAVEGHPVLRDIRRHHLGGVLLFDYDLLRQAPVRNIASPDQVKALVASLQEVSGTPLLVAVDQEGGRVARLKERHGFPPTPAHGELGRLDDPERTARESGRLAGTLASLGINLNLAPVVDLCAEPDNPVIARLDRCFSADPAEVARHALAFIEAHHHRGVLTVLKHFPGHGSSLGDSHLGLTDVTDTWTRAELEPFARIIAAGRADAVMTAHVFNARLDREDPATLSRATLRGLLRGELGFDGVILSDDLQMGAIADRYGLERAVRKAIEAGMDILVFGNNLAYDEEIVPRVVAMIRDLVASGAVDEARIDASWRRILRLKSRLAPSITCHPSDPSG